MTESAATPSRRESGTRPRVVVFDPVPGPSTWGPETAIFGGRGVDLVVPGDAAEADDAIRTADAVIVTGYGKLDADRVAGLERAVGILCYSIGMDKVDGPAAKAAGIPVRNVPDYCTDEVSDHARHPPPRRGTPDPAVRDGDGGRRLAERRPVAHRLAPPAPGPDAGRRRRRTDRPAGRRQGPRVRLPDHRLRPVHHGRGRSRPAAGRPRRAVRHVRRDRRVRRLHAGRPAAHLARGAGRGQAGPHRGQHLPRRPHRRARARRGAAGRPGRRRGARRPRVRATRPRRRSAVAACPTSS